MGVTYLVDSMIGHGVGDWRAFPFLYEFITALPRVHRLWVGLEEIWRVLIGGDCVSGSNL
jgi:hypothetical protein